MWHIYKMNFWFYGTLLSLGLTALFLSPLLYWLALFSYIRVVLLLSPLVFWWLGTKAWKFLWNHPVIPEFIRYSLNHNVFPDLNGDWVGQVQSNWNIVSRLLEKPGETSHEKISAEKPAEIRKIRVKIKADWFSIILSLESEDKYSNSISWFTIPFRDTRDPDKLILRYIYENTTPIPLKGDSGKHDGAGELELRWIDGLPVLAGKYWTNRSWTTGLNTAGVIRLNREGDVQGLAVDDPPIPARTPPSPETLDWQAPYLRDKLNSARQQWAMLHHRLTVLKETHINETRTEEKLRLEHVIKLTENESATVECEMDELEKRLGLSSKRAE